MAGIDYDFKPLTEANLHLVLPLYQKVFNRKFSIAQLRAKFFSEYSPVPCQAFFAFHDEMPVAFLSTIPFLMCYEEKTELSAQLCDAMTLPSYRRRGLITRLIDIADQSLRQKGFRFIWGFLNYNTEPLLVGKMGWQGQNRMRCFKIPISTFSQEALFRKTKIFSRYFQERLKKQLYPLTVDAILPNSAISEGVVATLRDRNYYRYKSFTPNYIIKLNNTLVWIKPVGGLLIGDMEIQSEKQFAESLEQLKILASKLGLSKITFQVNCGTLLDQLLSKRYAGFDTWLTGYKNYNSDFPLEKLMFTYGDLDTF